MAIVVVAGIALFFLGRRETVKEEKNVHTDLISQARIMPDDHSPKKLVVLDVGLSKEDRDVWYRAPEGSDIVPIVYLRALINQKTKTPFIESLHSYGFLPNPEDPNGLPYGFTANIPANDVLNLPYAGINCSACHTGLMEYKDTRVLIDGAPNLAEFEAFVIDFTESSARTMENPIEAFLFFRRFLKEVEAARKDGEAFKIKAETLAFMHCLDHEPGETKDDDNIPDHIEGEIMKLIGSSLTAAVTNESGEVSMPKDELDKLFKTIEHPEKETWLAHIGETIATVGKNIKWLIERVQFASKLHWAFDNQTYAGPGRGDSFDAVRDLMFPSDDRLDLSAPCSFVDLFDLKERQWVHWDANTTSSMERNIAQAIAFGAAYYPKTLKSSVLPYQLHSLETVARKIGVPKWPKEVFGAIDATKAARGGKTHESLCVGCHSYNPDTPQTKERLYSVAEVGTDPNRVVNFGTKLGNEPFSTALTKGADALEKKLFEQHKVGPDKAKELTFEEGSTWRTTGKYVARPLKGIWATAPFLHNGSVPNLWQLLQPSLKRPVKWKCGSRQFDPKHIGYEYDVEYDFWVFDTTQSGNHNTGHEGNDFGTELSDAEKWDLIEYLKTL